MESHCEPAERGNLVIVEIASPRIKPGLLAMTSDFLRLYQSEGAPTLAHSFVVVSLYLAMRDRIRILSFGDTNW